MAMGLSKLRGDENQQAKHNAARQGSDSFTGMNTQLAPRQSPWQDLQERQGEIAQQSQDAAMPPQQEPTTIAGKIHAAVEKKIPRFLGGTRGQASPGFGGSSSGPYYGE